MQLLLLSSRVSLISMPSQMFAATIFLLLFVFIKFYLHILMVCLPGYVKTDNLGREV